MNEFPKIVIGIPTYKRPEGLTKILNSILHLDVSGLAVSIVVAENDCNELAGFNVVTSIKPHYALPLYTIKVEQRGISFVRNALLDSAFNVHKADYLVMVDDDEWVETNWLQALVEAQKKLGCEVIGGIVLAEFEGEPPSWTTELPIYFPKQHRETIEIDLLESTGSVLLHKSVYFDFNQQRFDPFYSIYGGGDKEYFTRLKTQGIKFGIAHQAISHELFSESRVTKGWALERAFRIGAAEMRIIVLHHATFKRMTVELSKIVLALIFGSIISLLPSNYAGKKMKGRLLVVRQIGKINGLFNRQKPVYEKVHGK
ncbi:glycosyltransferase [Pseudoalteromonas sp. S16_S37]|uniref:glycosyltransferase n=1 Tax=Pseudoalteromonas sp. S16_S37 TaxID=2720228 RepID=UPI001681A8F0|nr:glycosyltransferase family 2 protein [Pseudoalteromonas sp. S16_S37]